MAFQFRWKEKLTVIFKHILAVFLLLVLPIVTFLPVFLNRDVIVSGDFSGSDLLDMHLPFKYVLHDSYREGRVPLWSRYQSNGAPFLAEGQSGALYPPHILLALLVDPLQALNYSVLLTFVIGGVGFYFYSLRFPGSTIWGSLLSAICFMFSSFFIARIKHLNMIEVGAYLPWSLLFVDLFARTGKRYFVLGLIFVWSMQLLLGHPHMAYLCILITFWVFLVQILFKTSHLAENSRRFRFRFFLTEFSVLLLAFLLACGLAAAQILPTLELIRLSDRVDFSFGMSGAYPMSLPFVITLLFPFALGNPAVGSYTLSIIDFGVWWENIIYIGLIPILFIFYASSKKIKHTYKVFSKGFPSQMEVCDFFKSLTYERYTLIATVLSGFVFFYWSFGRTSLLYLLSYYLVPGMNFFRFPTRFNLYVILVLCLLFGYFVSRYFYRRRFFPLILSSLFLLILVPLIHFVYSYVGFYPSTFFTSPLQTVTYLQKDSSLYRIYSLSQYYASPYLRYGWNSSEGKRAIGDIQEALPGDNASRFKLDSFSNRTWFEGGLFLKDRATIEDSIIKSKEFNEGVFKVLGMWNVKYLLSVDPFQQITYSGAQTVLSIPVHSFFEGPVRIFENNKVLPRAYLVPRVLHVADRKTELKYLFDPLIDPSKQSLISGPVAALPQCLLADGCEPSTYELSSSVDIKMYTDELVEMHVRTPTVQMLVFSDTFYPGWRVYVNGAEQTIHQINYVQRGVILQPGENTILWKYMPLSYVVGKYISLLSVSLYVLLIIFFVSRLRFRYAPKF